MRSSPKSKSLQLSLTRRLNTSIIDMLEAAKTPPFPINEATERLRMRLDCGVFGFYSEKTRQYNARLP